MEIHLCYLTEMKMYRCYFSDMNIDFCGSTALKTVLSLFCRLMWYMQIGSFYYFTRLKWIFVILYV